MSKINKTPNLFILGAPKCGTTTLAAWLSRHSQVYFSPEKEPHHFYSPYGRVMSEETYAKLFSEAPEGCRYLAEASVWYLFGGVAVPRILEKNPEARFIVCLRNPVQMAPSLHAQTLFTGRELLKHFEDAWAVSDRRFGGEHVGIFGFNEGDPSCMAYKQACMLGQQVENLLQQVDGKRVLFVLLDDLSAAPEECWLKVQEFLGLPNETLSLDIENKAKYRKFPFLQRVTLFAQNIKRRLGIKKRFGLLAFFNNRNIVQGRYPEPADEIKALMKKEFSKDVQKLSELINRDLSSWTA